MESFIGKHRGALICFSAALFLCAHQCKNPPSRKIAKLGYEKILRSYPEGETIDSIAATGVSGERAFVAWSTGLGIHGMLIDRDGLPAGEQIEISDESARYLHAGVSRCRGKINGILLLSVPFTSPLEGNKTAHLYFLAPDGKPRGERVDMGEVGPYSMGASLAALCDQALVALHTGKIGEFRVEASGVDLENRTVSWKKKPSTPGLNAFLPSVATNGELYALAWTEKKMTIGKAGSEFRQGVLKLSVLSRGGKFIAGPASVGRTFLAPFAPAIVFKGDTIVMAYKDHPEDEYRDGLYLTRLDREGKNVMKPLRLGRADGPSSPILLELDGGELATLVLRGLAGDLLVGINLLNNDGKKLQREIQIYGHSRKLKSVAAVALGKKVIALYSGCQLSHCYLFSITVDRL